MTAPPPGSAGGGTREGVLGRLTRVVYRLLAVEAAIVTATAPGLVGVLLLDRDASNIPLYGLCALPFGPAVGAAVFAVRETERSDEEDAWRQFWRAWRRDLGPSLAVWAPAVLLAALAAFNLAFAGTPVAGALAAAGAVVAVAAGVIGVSAVVVTAVFRFRVRDALRVTVYGLARRPLVALGVVSLLLVSVAVVVMTTDLVLVALASVLAVALVATTHPLVRVVEERFTAP